MLETTLNLEKIWDQIQDGGLHFLNTTIIPPGADGDWSIKTVSLKEAAHIFSGAGHMHDTGQSFIASHVGHEATAAAMSEIFGSRIAVDRSPWDGKGLGLAMQLNGRIAEGAILDRTQLEEMGYTLRILGRIPDSISVTTWFWAKMD